MRRYLSHLLFGSLSLGLLIAIGCTSSSDDSNGSAAAKSPAEDGTAGKAASDEKTAQGTPDDKPPAEPIKPDDPDKLANFFDPIPTTPGTDNSAANDGATNNAASNNAASGGTQAQTVGSHGDGANNGANAAGANATNSDAGNHNTGNQDVTNQGANTQGNAAQGQTDQNQGAQNAGDHNNAGQSGDHAALDHPAARDPVEVNGKIFENWPTPKLAIVFSGRQSGYFEPCGCAGLENMKGGTARRATMLAERRAAGWPVVAVDLGNFAKRFGKQAEIKSSLTLDALVGMHYDAIGFGPGDLALPLDTILTSVSDDRRPFVSANVKIPYLDVPKYRIIERGGMKIGITAVLGDAEAKEIQQDEIPIAPAAEALKEPYEKLLAEKCDVLILLAYASVEETEALAATYPEFTYACTAGGPIEPPYIPRANDNIKPTMIEVGDKGMYVNVVGLFDDAANPVRYQRVAMDSRFQDDPHVHDLLVEMQNQYKQLGWDGLGLRPIAHESGQTFVGAAKCGECHSEAYAIFENTSHAHATDTLAKLDPPRIYDPECVSCHTTGWEPQKYFPFGGGFQSIEGTPLLTGNGCENCHGPGSDHVKMEEGSGDDVAARDALRAAMRVSLETAQQKTCLQCHDLDNSPEYIHQGFDAYWPAVEHHGKN